MALRTKEDLYRQDMTLCLWTTPPSHRELPLSEWRSYVLKFHNEPGPEQWQLTKIQQLDACGCGCLQIKHGHSQQSSTKLNDWRRSAVQERGYLHFPCHIPRSQGQVAIIAFIGRAAQTTLHNVSETKSLPASQRGGGNRRGNALFSCGYWWPIKHSWNAGLWSDESSKHRFYPLPTITHHSIWPRWCDKILTMLGQLRGVLSVDRRQGILKASTWALRRGDEVWRSPTSLKLANSFSVVVAGQTSLQLHPSLRIMHWRYLTFDMDLTDNSLGMKIKHSWGVTHWWMVMCESLLPFSWCVYCTVHPGERNGRIDEYPWHGNPTSGETNQASAWKRQHWRVEGSESGSSVSFQLKLGVFRWDVHSATEHEGLLVRY